MSKPKVLAPPCRALLPMGDAHAFASRAPDEPPAPDPEAELRPVLGQRPTLEAIVEEAVAPIQAPLRRLGRDPFADEADASLLSKLRGWW